MLQPALSPSSYKVSRRLRKSALRDRLWSSYRSSYQSSLRSSCHRGRLRASRERLRLSRVSLEAARSPRPLLSPHLSLFWSLLLGGKSDESSTPRRDPFSPRLLLGSSISCCVFSSFSLLFLRSSWSLTCFSIFQIRPTPSSVSKIGSVYPYPCSFSRSLRTFLSFGSPLEGITLRGFSADNPIPLVIVGNILCLWLALALSLVM